MRAISLNFANELDGVTIHFFYIPGSRTDALPPKGFLNNAEVAELVHRLMTEVLGCREYIASGGDMGRGVTCYLEARYPWEVRGGHFTALEQPREFAEDIARFAVNIIQGV